LKLIKFVICCGLGLDMMHVQNYWEVFRTFSNTYHFSLSLQKSRNVVKHSSPQVGEGRKENVRATIFGAPCNVRLPYTPRELRRDFYGCQNVPTAVWLMQFLKPGNNDRDDADYDENDSNW